MIKRLLSFLKVAIPLAFGVFLIWYVFKDLEEDERTELVNAFKEANYFWILLSTLFGVLSHLSRAERWKYTIQPLGKTPKFWNSFFTVMIGYVANYALPRLGEVTRPALLGRYEKLSFNKLFGTIVAERVADLLILALIMVCIVFAELDVLKDQLYILLDEGSGKFSPRNILILAIVVLVAGGAFFFFMLGKSTNPFFMKIREIFRGIYDGILSILRMENKLPFILHTLFIWIMYIGMFYICFFSLNETADASFSAVLAAFVMGSLSIVFVQGGLGVFPIAIMETLMLYGISKTSALALGWILWSSQTLMIIILGVLSIPLLRWYNRNNNVEATTDHTE
ncbi:MAG: TIGR00374 family protein [Flavobacteriales bacterium]|nr:TIGR00374 family protein [Flavobacteriales bacterium]|tara:strand:+ start:1686 stop:2702 length:1017 start_codon:yes stop_codon:yes gene_type:complete